jgi:outer membrane protein assembly factor BamE (lipoprotein component of BamABCDE complex)
MDCTLFTRFFLKRPRQFSPRFLSSPLFVGKGQKPGRPKSCTKPSSLHSLIIIGGVCCLALTACSERIRTHGNFIDADRFEQVRVGSTTRADVNDLLGSPNSRGMVDNNIWYYVGQRTMQEAFFAPEIVDRQIIAVSFNADGVVTQIRRFDTTDATQIALIERTTPTGGHNLTFLQQMLGNFGRGVPVGTGRTPGTGGSFPNPPSAPNLPGRGGGF